MKVSAVLILCLVMLVGCRQQKSLVTTTPARKPLPLPGVAYPWLASIDAANTLVNRIAVLDGYTRVDVSPGSFAEWLRFLPLKPGCPPVHLYNGEEKGDQGVHVAVVNLDTGNSDLQQCADSVMRLRGEYLYSRKAYANIHFNFTSGARADFTRWAAGYRPVIHGNRVAWSRNAHADVSHDSFRAYMNTVFNYAGTASLAKEMQTISPEQIQIGDVFIHGGFPGHAVIVVDMARHHQTGEKIFLLAQGYMPAQEMHILRNPEDADLSPWYRVQDAGTLVTPEYLFEWSELKRFK